MARPLRPIIVNYTITAIDTEQTVLLPANTVDFVIRVRDTADSIKVAFVSTESGTNFITLDVNLPVYRAEDVYLTKQTLYVQSPSTDPVIEILAWV